MRARTKEILVEVGLKACELFVSFLVGYWFKEVHPNSGMEWILGTNVFLIFQMFELIVRMSQKQKEHQTMLSNVAESLVDGGATKTLLHVAMCYAERLLGVGETMQAWRKLSWYSQQKYLVTNYIDPKPFYESEDAKDVVSLQIAKLRSDTDFSIRKVFIWKDATERDSPEARAIVRLHREDPRAHMSLRGIVRGDNELNSELKNALESKIEGQEADFAIFDERVVLVWHLDKSTRRIIGGRVLVSEPRVKEFIVFFGRLFVESKPVDATFIPTPMTNSVSVQPMEVVTVREINSWPNYGGSFRALDYALRPGGWLDALPESINTRRFAARLDGQLVGFSILTDITREAAEIYLAVHPELTGRGIGRQIMESTLAKAFFEIGLSRVHLKVRVWHKRAITLYQKVGFVAKGQKREEVNGEMVDFQIMELQKADFKPFGITSIALAKS